MKLSPVAIEQLQKLMAQPEPKFIRVGVKNRGCSGLAYHLEYVEKPGKFDEVVEQEGVKVLIDSKALFSIIGSEMDWHEDKLSRRFVFRNPNISMWPFENLHHLRFGLLTHDYRGRMWLRRILHGLSTLLKLSLRSILYRTSRRLFFFSGALDGVLRGGLNSTTLLFEYIRLISS